MLYSKAVKYLIAQDPGIGMKRFSLAVTREQMLEGPLLGKIIIYTLPIMATGILQLLFNAADMVVVGRYAGDIALAAVGATGSIINLIINLFIGLSVGTSVCVAHCCGSKDAEGLSRVIHTSVLTSVIMGVFVFLIGFFGARTFLELMGTPEDVIDLSTLYMQIYFVGVPSSLVYNFGASILRSSGDTNRPLIFLTIAGVLNVILNLFFVIAFGMSVDGVAWATVVSQTVSAVLVISYLIRTKSDIHLDPRKLKIHSHELKNIIRIGLPAGFQGAMFSISNVIIQSSVNSFGSVFMSGNSAAANIEGFVYVSMNSFHQASLTFTGQNVGAGKFDRIDRVLYSCLLCVTVAGVLFGSLVLLFRYPLLQIYLPESPEAVEAGISRFMVIITTYFTCGMMDALSGSLRGTGSSFIPMIITILSICVLRIIWIYTVFAAFRTPFTLFLSYPVSWVICIICQFIYFSFLKRKLIRSRAAA